MSDLTTAKVGDLLYIPSRYGRGGRLATVERITPSGRVITQHDEFMPNGKKRGTQGWDITFAQIATPEHITTVRRNNLISAIANFKGWEKLTDVELASVANVIKDKSV